jgi:hypothetical protein
VGFRDDHEASVQRVEVLEQELRATKKELETANLRAVEVDDLRKRLAQRGAPPDGPLRKSQAVWAVAFVITVLLACVITYAGATRRAVAHEAALREHLESTRALAEEASESLRQQRDAARAELAQIDDAHATEIHRLERDLNAAHMHEAGRALLVIGHITSREGNVPEGVTDECVLAIRDIHGGGCAAAVLCGGAEVFPFNLPSPPIHCTDARGASWMADGESPLASVNAAVDRARVPLLAYDAAARTLEVRETGAPVFALRLRVTDVLAFRVR